jgi:steroid 5-alpha reductase family enzyme
VSWGPLLVNLAVTAALVVGLMLATFAYAMRTRVHAIMDTIWPLGFVLIALVSFFLSAGSGDGGRRVLMLVLVAVWAIYEHARLGLVSWLGVAVWAVGFAFEAVGDLQLRRFRADPGNAGRVLDTGLWRYTRHPNYFGDATVWFGLWLLACSHWLGLVLVVSPLYMTNMLVRHTGKRLLEKHMARSKGAAYAEYVRRTSGFVPWPPR